MKRPLKLSIQRFGIIVGSVGAGMLLTTTSAFASSNPHKHKPVLSSRPHVHTSAGIGGGTSGCKTSTVYVNPAFHWCARVRVTPSQPHKSSKPLPSGGTGQLHSLPKTPHSVPISTSPKPTTSKTPKPKPSPTAPVLPAAFTSLSVVTPWTFNGCETNPAVTGTTQDPSRDLSDAPGEP
ncbi:MAG: hypothetical protein C7B44_14665, partial [Sulfobacillus thermosulfidooxidans]